MRLINTHTYRFREFYNSDEVKYVILSHVWRDEEVLYGDLAHGMPTHKSGHVKLESFCRQARRDNHEWAWIDTACIDKTSSAELSEAINSMYTWYRDADTCYVFLDDVEQYADIPSSKWITRGWTLQELIAPSRVTFFNKNWSYLGSRRVSAYDLSVWTGIEQAVLEGLEAVQHISVATRMSWAAKRETTRIEDQAYCLLGLFGVNMPLLYGEREEAFYRLQEEILRISNDQSILTYNHGSKWRPRLREHRTSMLLASSPSDYTDLKVCQIGGSRNSVLELTKAGLRIALQLTPVSKSSNEYWGILDCRYEGDLEGKIAIPLKKQGPDGDSVWSISLGRENTIFEAGELKSIKHEEIIISNSVTDSTTRSYSDVVRSVCMIKFKNRRGLRVKLADSLMNGVWNQKTSTSEVLYKIREDIVRTFVFKFDKRDIGFLVRFVDASLSSKMQLLSPGFLEGQFAYFASEVKPPDTEFATWSAEVLEHHDPKPMLGANWRASGNKRSPYRRWSPTQTPRFRSTIDLSMYEAGLKVNIEIYAASSDLHDGAVWYLELETEEKSTKRKQVEDISNNDQLSSKKRKRK